jgi:hypothetical protein
MEIQSWIFGQIVIDIVIAVILILFIFFQFRKKGDNEFIKPSLRNAEDILAEIEQITEVMGKNLEEKRELSARIIEQLEQVILRAEKSRKQFQKIIKDYNTNMGCKPETPHDMENTKHSINSLLNKGVSRKEISQHLGISLAEIDLLLKLQT